jgi:RNA polymerase sigma factor (sigma-70 family)
MGRIIMQQLLSKLPQSLRVPVELKYYSNMNATEIGETLNLPAATVRTRLRTAMQQLRNE